MGKRSKKNSRTWSVAGKTQSSNSLEEEKPSLNLPMINERFSKSESSHKDLSSRVGRIEEQLTETNQTLSKLTKMMEVMMSENSNSARPHGNPPRRNHDQAPAIAEEILEEVRPVRGVRSFEQQQLQNFPIFNGENPTEWIAECDYYFEVMNFFLRSSGKPFDESKRVQQQGRVRVNNSAKNSVNSESTLSLEQKRLPKKCGEKYFQGQKCSNQNYPKSKAMEFEGRIGVIPIIALMVSGSTHSFLKPTIAQKLKLQVTHTNPLILQTANGTRVQTNSLCRSQKFELQEQEFEANLRLLEIPDYDMILGSDWIAQFGTMCMDLGKGIVKMKHKGKHIQLAIGKKLAVVKVCEQEPEILHLFCMEEVKS